MTITDIQVLMLIVFIAIIITLSDMWIAYSYHKQLNKTQKDIEDLKEKTKCLKS